MVKQVEASIKLFSFNCPHCGAFSQHDWFSTSAKRLASGELPKIVTVYDVEDAQRNLGYEITEKDRKYIEALVTSSKMGLVVVGSPLPINADSHTGYFFLARCYACKNCSVWIRDNMVYPKGSKLGPRPNEDLPSAIKEDYEEARSILDFSPRGACALLRLCLQKICAHVGETGKNINDDIRSLEKKGLPSKIVRAMDVLRVTGNEAVHPGTMDIKDDRETALNLFSLLNTVAQHLISEPDNIDRMFNSLPASKRGASL